MPTKIRLQRHGKKRYAYYHVVVADARAPRDGKFIEKLGTYNPNENPARIDIDFDRSLHWVKEGAQPTDTVRALLSYKGIMHKDHLDRGVIKGALTQDQADKKFEAWMTEKESKVVGKKDGLAKAADADSKARLAAETEIKNKRASEVLAKQSELAAAVQAEADEKAAIAAEKAAEKAALANPVKEEATPEAKEEAPVAEAKEEAAPEAKAEEAPATEEKKEN
ncbi:MAG: 30S ribosomal protein S16 [Vicingaceae bacterium]|jgi:small subunit ribosomal protein S16